MASTNNANFYYTMDLVVSTRSSLACSDGSVLHQWTLAGKGLSWRSLWEVRDDLAHVVPPRLIVDAQ